MHVLRDGELMEKPEVVDYIVLEPDYPTVVRFFLTQFITHGFDRGAATPMFSFIQQIIYLEHTQPKVIKEILKELEDGRWGYAVLD